MVYLNQNGVARTYAAPLHKWRRCFGSCASPLVLFAKKMISSEERGFMSPKIAVLFFRQ